jgi:hypothetical protein
MVQLLAERRASLDRRGGEWSTPPSQYRTAYANAVLRGRTDIVALLTELGASTELSPGDRAVAALARGERPDGPFAEQLDADSQEVIILGALSGQLERVVDALGLTFSGTSAAALLGRCCTTPPG